MRRRLALAPLAAAIALPGHAADRTDVPAGYALVWSDEFDREGLPDPATWAADTHANRTGWYNDEKQYYSSGRAENARIENGALLIVARRESLTQAPDYGGQHFTSARLVTQGLASWTYGFFEIRAKLPCGKGTWPAIWTLGTRHPHPDGGEIDIMEHVGADPEHVSSTIHTRATAGTHGDGASLRLPDACTAFHRYQLTWTRDRIATAVDGRPVHSYARRGRGPGGWPFDEPQYLLLNLAIGGEMAGETDPRMPPRTFAIDYVRVYQRR